MEGDRKRFLNVLVLGVSFMLVFTAFQTCGNVEETVLSSLNETSNESGYLSLSIIYGVFSVSNIIAPSVVAMFGPKLSMIFGGVVYSIYMATFIEPMTWSFYTASVAIGVAAAVLWTAQGTCLTLNSDSTTMARNTGIFWALLQCSLLFGNLYVYISWRGKTRITDSDRRVLFIVLAVISLAGSLLLLTIRQIPSVTSGPSLEEQSSLMNNPEPSTAQVGLGQAKQALRNSVKLFFTRHMFFLSACMAYTGLELTFFSGVYGTCLGATNYFENAKSLIGLSGMFVGVGEITGGGLFGVVSQRLRLGRTRPNRGAVVILGLVTHAVAFFLAFLNLPSDAPISGGSGTNKLSYLNPSVPVALLCSFLLGFGDSCYNTQLYSVLGSRYAKDSAPAFAIFKFVQSITAAIAFFYSNYLLLQWQLLILILSALIGTLSFIVAETLAPMPNAY
uniref:UNC93-like protein MFSD11 n=1 Tax=Myxine glutinosa TaxID=7769 RepID=UPI00358F03EB